MSQLALPASFAQNAAEPSSIWGIVESVLKLVAGTFIVEREHRLLGLIRPTAETIGTHLLAAGDRADLDDRLETVIGWPDVYQLNARLLLDPELDPHESQDLLEQVQINGNVALAFLSDPHIHPDIKDALLEGARADHCLWALIHVITSKQAPEPWLRAALAQRSADGYYEILRLLASDPRLEVPPGIVPESHRHNLAALQFEAAKTDAWLHEFATSNGDVVFPFASDDDT